MSYGLLAVALVAAGCDLPREYACYVNKGALGADPAAASVGVTFCEWNGSRDRPSLVLGGENLKIAIEVDGSAPISAAVAWTGLSPWMNRTVNAVDTIDQSLASGQAALFANLEQPPTDLPSTGGGSTSLVGKLPAAARDQETVTIGFSRVSVANGGMSALVDGSAEMILAVVPVE